MVNTKNLREHLDSKCPPENLSEKDGIIYLSIDKCERMLDELAEEFKLMWGTRNYRSTITVVTHQTGEQDLLISASLELYLVGQGYRKYLVGTASFYASDYAPNRFYDSIAKSLCTVNAASDLGDWFGRFLANQEKRWGAPAGKSNDKKVRRESVRMKPDLTIRKSYATAVSAKDYTEIDKLERLYDFEAEK